MNLYRKYRPQTFKDVSGQEHIKASIVGQLEANDVAHAYVFSGPRGVGKTTIARLIAKSVNCLVRKKGSAEPCGTCQTCTAIQEGRLLEVIEIDAASHTSVDHVREHILERVRVTPAQNRRTVFIIDEAHMLSKSAFNALLKTLEEPPEHVIFILATTELHKIPDTIVSRCQRFQFFMLSPEVMMKRLKEICEKEGKRVDEDVLREVAYRSGGSQRDAESLLDQLLRLEQNHVTREIAITVIPMTDIGEVEAFLRGWATSHAVSSIQTLQTIVQNGSDLKGFTALLLEVLRGILLARIGAKTETMAYTTGQCVAFAEMFREVSEARISEMLSAVQEAAVTPSHEALPQLPLELMTIRVCCSRENNSEAQRMKNIETRNENQPAVGDDPRVVPSQAVGDDPLQDRGGALHAPMQAMANNLSVIASPLSVIASEAKQSQPHAIAIVLDDVKKHWSTFQSKLKKKHASLPLALELAEPISVEGSSISVRVPFAFYAETVNIDHNNRLLSTLMSEILGAPVRMQAVYEAPAREVIDSVVNAFGGTVEE